MAGTAQSNKDQARAKALVAAGYPHGRRFTSGLSNIPQTGDVGSAAYRRLQSRLIGK